MNILETLLSSQGGQAVKHLGQQFGLQAEDTEALVRRLLPALAGGVERNVREPGGLESLSRALSGGKHQRYLDDPTALEQPETVDDGNAILGHLFGSKEVSRDVAGRVSADTGVDSSIIKKLLPVVAAAAMGALSKQTGGGSNLGGGGLAGLLAGVLGGGGGAGMVGDLLSRGKKLL